MRITLVGYLSKSTSKDSRLGIHLYRLQKLKHKNNIDNNLYMFADLVIFQARNPLDTYDIYAST